MTLKELKKGDYFTKKSIAEPTEKQVFVKGEYDRETKKYIVYRLDDISYSALMAGNKEVFTDFTF